MKSSTVIWIIVVLAIVAIVWLWMSSSASASASSTAALLSPKGSTPGTKDAALAGDGGPTGAASTGAAASGA